MNKLRILAVSGAMLLSHAGPGWPQAQHLLRVKVVNEFDRPLPGISFRIAFVGDYRSDSNGEREIMLPAGMGPGQPIEFELKNDSLAIFEPARGRDKVPDRDAIILKLLRLGDHRLLNREEMKALMNKLISETTKKETQRLLAEKTQLAQQLASAPQDPLAEDAKRLGFSKKELLVAIEKVKAQLQESENPYDVGLAALYDKHYGKAAQLIEQAIAAAEKKIREGKREEELLSEKYLNLGNARAGEHKLNEAVAAYEKAIALQPDDADGYFDLANVLYVMGDAKGMMKNWQKALTIYRRASRGEATANEAAALGNLGLVFSDLGQPDSSRVYFQATLKIDREIGYRQGEASQLGNLGLVFSDLGQSDSSRVYFQAALKIDREIGYRQGEATHLSNLGLLFSDLGQPDSSWVYHQAALKIDREIGYPQGEAQQLIALGLLFSGVGEADSAIVYYKVALKIHKEIGFHQGEATALGNLALVFSDLGQPDSSRMYHQAALKIAREIGYRQGEASILGNLGLVFSDLRQPDSSRVYHQAALKIACEIGYRQGEASAFGNLGLVFSDLGQPDSARVYHQAALKIAREIGHRLNEANQLGNLGGVFRNLGQPDSSRVYLKKSLKIFVEIQSPTATRVFNWMNEINEQMSQRFIVAGDAEVDKEQFDSARVNYELALADGKKFGYAAGTLSALGRLSFLFHEKLFRFPEAFAIDQQRLQLDSTDLSFQADFAEKHFTTGRFPAAEKRLAALLANPEVSASTKIALRAIQIANALAQNKTQQVPAALEILQQSIAAQPDTFQVGWTFNGTKHFISQNERLAPYRAWLLQLFSALENEGGEAIHAALREVREKFKTVAGK